LPRGSSNSGAWTQLARRGVRSWTTTRGWPAGPPRRPHPARTRPVPEADVTAAQRAGNGMVDGRHSHLINPNTHESDTSPFTTQSSRNVPSAIPAHAAQPHDSTVPSFPSPGVRGHRCRFRVSRVPDGSLRQRPESALSDGRGTRPYPPQQKAEQGSVDVRGEREQDKEERRCR
jgi:hypothetical protein